MSTRATRPHTPLRFGLALPLGLGATLVLGVALGGPGPAQAAEGQWKPSQIVELHTRAARDGLTLSAEQLWDPDGDERDGGLLRASVNFGGCSAAFISADGLIATNHHCAFGALQANSSVDHDYLADGFLAASRADELPAPGKTIRVLRSIEDVSETIAEATEGIDDDRARGAAISRAGNRLVDACEAADEHLQCSVASFFLDSKFELHTYLELEDVRLVYAPPSAIGEYGGETDNWMWPRHTGDFSLLRAYVGPDGLPAPHAGDNTPYKPAQWLKPATSGVHPGDFVAILGYPGHTDRYMWSAELDRHQGQVLARRVLIYGEWIEILEAASAKDEAVAIKVAATKKSLANRHKNAAGKIAGLENMKLLGARRAEDASLKRQSEDAKATLEALEALSRARSDRSARSFLLHNLRYAPRSLAIAYGLAQWSAERAKPDLERRPGYRDRDRDRVEHRLEQLAKDRDLEVDVALLASFLRYADALPKSAPGAEDREPRGGSQRSPGFDAILKGGSSDDGDYDSIARATLAGSSLTDPTTITGLLDKPEAIAAHSDPLLVLARALVTEISSLRAIEEAERGQFSRLGPAYFELLSELRPGPLYSDANGTLRLSHATVKGYDKWDGSTQRPQTTLGGALAKHTGEGEFDLPEAVLAAAETRAQSVWVDPVLGDVPVCFLADGDTTGGNSGSPVVNGAGELVGFNFDRVWENVAGDYAWRPSHSRNVISDVRYLYWMLTEVEHADALLTELGVADYRPAPRPADPAPADAQPKEKPKGKPAPPVNGCACSLDTSSTTSNTTQTRQRGPGGALLFGLLLLSRLRRRSRSRSRGHRGDSHTHGQP